MRRKKWREEEEETLITKYGEMALAGTLLKFKTREKKFGPIAAHVNDMHHSQDSVAFPWEWSWRDLSVKIQNMRHQYLGVKQKIRRPTYSPEAGQQEEYDWTEGIVHWSNFLRYKEVFGDLELDTGELGNGGSSPASQQNNKSMYDGKMVRGRGASCRMALMPKGRQPFICNSRLPGEGGGSTVGNLEVDDPLAGLGEAGVSEPGLICYDDGDDGREDDELGSKKKKLKCQRDRLKGVGNGEDPLSTEGKILAFLGAYITEQRERDAQREAREREKEREREEREVLREAAERERELSRHERERRREEQERRRERDREEREWERDVVNRDRGDEERQRERMWEEKREKEKQEWKERMSTLELRHQAAIAQLQGQMMQCQQNVVSLLLGVVLHGSPVEETPGQRSSLALQILHNLQQPDPCGGTFQSGERKGGIEDNTPHYVMD